MVIAFVADVHLGNHKRFGGEMIASMNVRCRMALDVFERAATAAIEAKAEAFIVAGDLFDYVRPEAPLIANVQEILHRLDSAGCQPILLIGNHDQNSGVHGDHALAPLEMIGAEVDEEPNFRRLGTLEILTVPFRTGHAREWLAEAVRGIVGSSEQAADRPCPPEGRISRLLVLHLGIKDARTAPWLAGAADSIDVDILDAICAEHGIDYVFAGNWHDRRSWNLPRSKAYVQQLGALVPTGWDNPGIDGYGTLALFDDEADTPLSIVTIPGPRFVKARSKKEAQVEMASARVGRHKLFVSLDADPDDLEELTGIITNGIERKDIYAGEVLPNLEAANIKAKSAAFAAKSSKTLQEALAAFVKAMPLPDTVSRTAVLERARGYVR